ncbi:piggyBac transposable element-derived protein 3-like, partial [Cherax quadricarinatus]|uniref:piggyBac transposable element-derived protein 3-like n=1 Tax=Cherax quadricarinatus TaxID=27406 RepID=UPI00387ED46E
SNSFFCTSCLSLSFFDENITNAIVYQTNLYSIQKGKVIAVTKDELCAFLGINVMMDYHRLPALRHYWAISNDMGVRPIQEAMAHGRFLSILSKLHLNANTKMDPNRKDKLYELTPLIESLNNKFRDIGSPGECVNVGESMIRFKGRCTFKQYNPIKPIKREYKLWCIADNNGYIFNFAIYKGKGEDKDPIKRKETLQGISVQARVTIRPTRMDFPPLENDNSLHSIQLSWIYNHNCEEDRKNGTKTVITCSQALKDYNENMGGVDKHDMLRQLYGANSKSKKWWHRIFLGLLGMSIVNANVVYNETHSPLSLLEFRRELAQGLLAFATNHRSEGAPKRRKVDYSVPTSVRPTNTGIHWPKFIGKKGRYEICTKKGGRITININL